MAQLLPVMLWLLLQEHPLPPGRLMMPLLSLLLASNELRH
jgi:hypothetical protein